MAAPEVVAACLEALNAPRKAAGLAPLELDAQAGAVAQAHAESMATLGFVSHWDPSGRAPYVR